VVAAVPLEVWTSTSLGPPATAGTRKTRVFPEARTTSASSPPTQTLAPSARAPVRVAVTSSPTKALCGERLTCKGGRTAGRREKQGEKQKKLPHTSTSAGKL
jgi:hypothetical protein